MKHFYSAVLLPLGIKVENRIKQPVGTRFSRFYKLVNATGNKKAAVILKSNFYCTVSFTYKFSLDTLRTQVKNKWTFNFLK